ncbi:hypothetical protein BD289DRAFT_481747 [Coniella lustricola]|uniref:DUF7907 domain-containing protein n=1 Tax=Coniella lustricola TaxID=2025994 RepID=A0A2T3ABB5_9PEZI|nr:hypothetical protein BD289DRAFT_481747 [Coniella lustricola]
MKHSTIQSTSLVALLSSLTGLATAQDYTSSEPFTLQLSSSYSDVDGSFLGACHAGAAIEELCVTGTDGTPAEYNTFALNTSSADASDSDLIYDTGILVWTLPASNINVSEGLIFPANLATNVVAPLFEPGSNGADVVGFDDDNLLFIYSNYVDDKNFTAGVYPAPVEPYPLYQWYACYTYYGAYYYQTLAWVTGGEPNNPTCEAVNVTRIFI